MKALLLCALLSSGAGAAKAPVPDALDGIERLFASGLYEDVSISLEGNLIQKIRKGRRARAYELLGLSYEMQGRLDRALAVYQLAEGLYPENLVILNRLARLLHRIELDVRARPVYERLLRIHPNNADGNLGLAEILRGQGLLEASARHYRKALKEFDKDPAVWRDYAEVLADRQDFVEATKAIQRSLELRFDVDSLLDLALFERRQGQRAQSMKTLRNAAAGAPQRSDLKLRLALWMIEDGDHDGALEAAGSVLRDVPGHPLARWTRARVHIARGRPEEARRDLEAAAQAERTSPFIASAAKALLRLLAEERGGS